MRLQGQVAVVTGAGSGIGRAIAAQLLLEGGRVVAVDWRGDLAAATLADLNASPQNGIAVEADVTQPADVERLRATVLDSYGQIDILVNNAGIVEGDDIMSIEPDVWDRNIESVLKSVYLCSRACLKPMLARRQGAIVNLASVNGIAAFGDDAYSAAKAGVISLTKAVAVRYGRIGVRCNAVAPGDIRTPRWEGRLRLDPLVLERLSKLYPLGRIGEPEDVAAAVVFLASDDARWITGSVLVVDGGLMAGRSDIMRAAYPQE
jgi:NAD(P)-dependent dehydrogenase (short-subunit alcohol dehydrogenase family)